MVAPDPRANVHGMVLSRPRDATLTMVSNPTSKGRNFVDFASKLFAMTNRSATLVFDAWTQDVLYQVNVPPAMSNFSSKLLYGGGARVWDELQKQCLHFVALPHKLILAGFSWANLRHAGQLISISSSLGMRTLMAWLGARWKVLEATMNYSWMVIMQPLATAGMGAELGYTIPTMRSLVLLVVSLDTVITWRITS
jgi:hypothetical protein